MEAALERAASFLPHQGPIGVFIHQNPLEHLEGLPFEEAAQRAWRALGAEPYLDEASYRAAIAGGRIEPEDLRAVLGQASDAETAGPGSLDPLDPARVRELLLAHGLDHEPDQARRFRRLCGSTPLVVERAPRGAVERAQVEGTAALAARLEAGDLDGACALLAGQGDPDELERRLLEAYDLPRDLRALRGLLRRPLETGLEMLRVACEEAAAAAGPLPPASPPSGPGAAPGAPVTHRELILAAGGADLAQAVDPLFLRLVAAFLDRGLAHWEMPGRERGLLSAALSLLDRGALARVRWYEGLGEACQALRARDVTGPELLAELLAELGVAAEEQEAYLRALLHEAPGWAGLVRWHEHHPGGPPARLVDYAALRLLFARHALGWATRGLEPLARGDLRAALRARLPVARPSETEPARRSDPAHVLFQLALLAGAGAPTVRALAPEAVRALLATAAALPGRERRRLLQLAFERRFQRGALDALLAHLRAGTLAPRAAPELQVITCIDDREESFRRALEETLGPRVETLGAAGFFELAMRYRGVSDAREVSLCPIVLQPRQRVVERTLPGATARLRRLEVSQRLWLRLARAAALGSRALTRGALWSLLLGPFATLVLVARLLFPRASSRLHRRVARALVPPPETTLIPPGPEAFAPGALDPAELSGAVAALVRSVGLEGRLAPLVLVIGHGSSTLNNPLASAYDCGACGGYRGGPNARLLAQAANRPELRARMAADGLSIPPETWFLGALHDTTSDALTLYDLEAVPASHRARVEALVPELERARALNALERCRRFESAPLGLTPQAALLHVEGRAASLAEPRPELGHATNAMCLVGRRALTRGLFLDRRAFLVSYDPAHDASGALLARLLGAVAPVCAGINLEYYFSRTDNERYGCGTKLPHNVTGLVGVMNGHLSDLRTGLPQQMVEVHDPLRLLLVVEAAPARLLAALEQLPRLRRLADNEWLALVALEPDAPGGPAAARYRDGGFEPYPAGALELPRATSSRAYVAGTRDPLPPARIEAGTPGAEAARVA
ncbi:MAG: putative inorganic carbon transporter subunit DabA [Planctomycetota bacterium]